MGLETRVGVSSFFDSSTLRAETPVSPEFALGWEPSPVWGRGGKRSLHLYYYALNNPLRYTDPDGHDPEDLAELRAQVVKRAKEHPAVMRRLRDAREGGQLLGRMNRTQLEAYLNAPLEKFRDVNQREAVVAKEADPPSLGEKLLELADARYGGVVRGVQRFNEAGQRIDEGIENKPTLTEFESVDAQGHSKSRLTAIKEVAALTEEGLREEATGIYNVTEDASISKAGWELLLLARAKRRAAKEALEEATFGGVSARNASEADFLANASATFGEDSVFKSAVRFGDDIVIQRSDIEYSVQNLRRMRSGASPFVRNAKGEWETVTLHHVGRKDRKVIEVLSGHNAYNPATGGPLHVPGPGGPARQPRFSQTYWQKRYNEILNTGTVPLEVLEQLGN